MHVMYVVCCVLGVGCCDRSFVRTAADAVRKHFQTHIHIQIQFGNRKEREIENKNGNGFKLGVPVRPWHGVYSYGCIVSVPVSVSYGFKYIQYDPRSICYV